ncbi:unnamed protein product [Peronospora belbahrii]|uniref:Jacalin-type lectin domain-containing protein n=1 Tax=Peronospora belbahrii TaxID=622444 RepID=A0ABN8CZ12_9STRA|nr:unnamed protein product [Peronospora belbahrii]
MAMLETIITILLVITGLPFAATEELIDEDIQLSKVYGGPYGDAFSDMQCIKFGQILQSVTLRANTCVVAVTTRIRKPVEVTWGHGGSDGQEATLLLDTDEYINKVEIHWAKRKKHDRVFFLNISTSGGNCVWAGTKTSRSVILTAPKGFQLSGFFGRAAAEVDQLGVIWTRRSAKSAQLTDTMDTGWYGKSIRNWVGPTIGHAKDTACYRVTKPHDSNKACPAGYNKKDGDCIAQCPLAYPVTCFLECIPQNDVCAYEIVQKATAMLATVVNVATAGALGIIASMKDKMKSHFFCAANVVGVMRSLIYFIRFHQTTAPHGTVEELLAIAYQSDVVLVDLPVAISHCLNIPVSSSLVFSGVVMMIVEGIARQTILHGDDILSSAKNVYRFIQNATAVNITDTSVDELQDFLDSNSTCGYQLKRLTDYVILSVNKVRDENPNATISDIRVIISKSKLILTDIPAATNNCFNEMLAYKTQSSAFQTRDLLRKTFGVIVDQLVEKAATNMGAFVAEAEYVLETMNLGLTTFAGLDPTKIVWLASQFIQPVCGPTAFIGEIDDGSLYDALGLTIVDETFIGSYGTWSKKGDGVVKLVFTSIHTKSVKIKIHSGGKFIVRVTLDPGAMMTWNSTVARLQEKTLYLEQERTSFLGFSIPGGGGSLKLWVPRSSEGGHLVMHVRVNIS